MEDIPIILDQNEQSISALKVHLINLIIENRLYKGDDYENLKLLFLYRNKNFSEELA